MSVPAATRETLADAVDRLFDKERYEAVIAMIETAIEQGRADARAWQMLGLARRELLDSAGAIAALEQAAKLAPADPRIAHALARSTLEAGRPSVDLYKLALSLAPSDAMLIAGQAAALAADGRGREGEGLLRRILSANPGWYDGHAAFARLSAATALGSESTLTVREALASFPLDTTLWKVALRILLDERRYAEAIAMASEAEKTLGKNEEWLRARAIALSELGQPAQAQDLFDALPASPAAIGIVQRIRNLIRLERFDEAVRLIEPGLPGRDDEPLLWPYRALLWRLLGDSRWEWLEGDPRLIGTYRLDLSDGEIRSLAELLRSLHQRSGNLPDQSVRQGTQTDGNLLARAEPEIARLRAALLEATAAHVAQLPPARDDHPTLSGSREPRRITGSWSVRLSAAGFHADHVHPHGWLSSAFYVALPPGDDASEEGWLTFGECRSLLPDFAAFRTIKPAVGTLALFPSTMWHGTRPFGSGERMTVAYDIARPRGSLDVQD